MRFLRLLLLASVLTVSAAAQAVVGHFAVPDLKEYKTLKCDFHLHTVFSDGDVWPTYRVQEAYREGLDAIALTDHLEYQPKADYVSKDHNAAHRIAAKAADEKGLILIPGAEITRSMPPGHLNAIFVTDANLLVKDDWKDAVEEAHKQGALVFWNHPGWESQQPDGIPRWYAEHTTLVEKGILTGIEIVNNAEWYPDVFTWCVDKKLTMAGNSDMHQPTHDEFSASGTAHRPLTLVFATEKSAAAIKDALMHQRTAVYFNHGLIGEDRWLRELFERSVTFSSMKIKAAGRERATLRITNASDIPFQLSLVDAHVDLQFPRECRVPAGKTVEFVVRARKSGLRLDQRVTVNYEVKNLVTGADRHLIAPLVFDVSINP